MELIIGMATMTVASRMTTATKVGTEGRIRLNWISKGLEAKLLSYLSRAAFLYAGLFDAMHKKVGDDME